MHDENKKLYLDMLCLQLAAIRKKCFFGPFFLQDTSRMSTPQLSSDIIVPEAPNV